jgi:hypothetical protein
MIFLGVPVTILAITLLVLAYGRLRARQAKYNADLNDDHVRSIVEDGFVSYEVEDALDLDEIDEAERDFWTEERWDEGEEW